LAVAQQIAPLCSAEDQRRLARSIDHRRVVEVCKWVGAQPGAGKQAVQSIVMELQENSDVVQLASIFQRLQQARHEADYDHLADIPKASTLAHIRQAERALDLLDALAGQVDGQRFLALIALHTQLR
jgi:hypothetical protein